jgi:3-hydroxybutyryl-CoA dehydrogenase
VSTAADPGEAASGADLLVESLPEDLELKAAVLRAALAEAPEAVVATNTSSLSISAIGDAIGAPGRTVGTHYLNPPLLMPPVEVIAGVRTAGRTVDLVRQTLVALGKLPVVVRRDVPGFVWNRLQFALVRECAWLVEQGVASAQDVDTVMREGLARRWRRVGPLRAVALGDRHLEPRRPGHRPRPLDRTGSCPICHGGDHRRKPHRRCGRADAARAGAQDERAMEATR